MRTLSTEPLECRVCKTTFTQKKIGGKTICSSQCRRVLRSRQAKMRHRKLTQTPKETNCNECGVWFTTLVRTNCDRHYCSNECMNSWGRKQSKHLRREREQSGEYKNRGIVSLKWQYKKFNGVCQICGCRTEMLVEYAPRQATVDHKVPLSKGGLHVEDNLQLACHACNSAKCDQVQ